MKKKNTKYLYKQKKALFHTVFFVEMVCDDKNAARKIYVRRRKIKSPLKMCKNRNKEIYMSFNEYIS